MPEALPGVSEVAVAGHSDAAVRRRVADELPEDHDLRNALLALLSWDLAPEVRIVAAARVDGDQYNREYSRLAGDEAVEARLQAVWHTMHSDVLLKLAKDADPRVRAAVADRVFTPVDAMKSLARDRHEDVRYAVAGASNAPDEALSALVNDVSERVAKKAKKTLRRRNKPDEISRDVHGSDAELGALGSDVRMLLETRPVDPGDVLHALAKTRVMSGALEYDGPWLDARRKLAQQPWMPAEVLRSLAKQHYDGVREAVAGNESTPAEVLEDLCLSEVAEVALANPNTPPDTLRMYAWGRDQVKAVAAIANPTVPVDLSDFATGGLRKAVAANPAASPELLTSLANDADTSVRCEVAKNPSTPIATLELLAHHPVPGHSGKTEVSRSDRADADSVWASLLRNPKIPPSVFEAMLEQPSAKYRLAGGGPWAWCWTGQPLPLHVIRALAEDDDPHVRHRLALNPETPDEIAERLMEDPEVVNSHDNDHWSMPSLREKSKEGVLENRSRLAPLPRPTTPEEAAAVLIRALPVRERRSLAREAPSSHIANLLCQDPSPEVREEAASSRTTPESSRSRLVADPEPRVRRAVAQASMDAAALLELAHHQVPIDRNIVPYIVELNRSAPAAALAEIAGRGLNHITIAGHPNSSSGLLAELAASDKAEVRAKVATNPNTSTRTLATLARDTVAQVRQLVAAHQNTQAETLAALARDPDPSVRLVTALNRHTSPDDLLALARDSAVSVRQVVAQSPRTPSEAWGHLLLDSDVGVRHLAVSNMRATTGMRERLAAGAATPPETLTVLAIDPSLMVRMAVVGNRRAPAEALALLAADAEQQIRLLVAKRRDAPHEVLSALTQDASWRVRRAAATGLRR